MIEDGYEFEYGLPSKKPGKSISEMKKRRAD